jgi:LemA protein
MSKGLKYGIGCLVVIVIIAIVIGGMFYRTYNKLVVMDEDVNNAWAQVQTVLQRRMDLIPNLVETVKGYATHERETLEAVIQARANATKMQVNPGELANDPAKLKQFMDAQNGLGAALGRLMVVAEQYPNLKANENFIRLQDELAGTENRIAVERRRFNDMVKVYNQKIRVFPTIFIANLMGLRQRPYFEAPAEAQVAPKVDFSNK